MTEFPLSGPPACIAVAVSHWIEHQTGWSVKKFLPTARRFRTRPDDLAKALA